MRLYIFETAVLTPRQTEQVRALEQAAEYGHSARRELCYLLAHGLFHLMGYDHMTDEDKPVMRAMEEKALASIGLTREE